MILVTKIVTTSWRTTKLRIRDRNWRDNKVSAFIHEITLGWRVYKAGKWLIKNVWLNTSINQIWVNTLKKPSFSSFLSSFRTSISVCFTLLPFNPSRARNPPCFCLCLISFKSTHSSPDSKSSTIINYLPSPAPNNPPCRHSTFPRPGERKKEGGRSKRGRNGARKIER